MRSPGGAASWKAENLIKEANNDAGLAAHPSGRWMMNCNWFQIAMLAYNLNCWLQLFNREEGEEIGSMRHTTLATARFGGRQHDAVWVIRLFKDVRTYQQN
jgi:hypothetical protein